MLDFLFLQRDRDSGSLVQVDYDGDGLVTRLIDGTGAATAGPAASKGSAARISAGWPTRWGRATPPRS